MKRCAICGNTRNIETHHLLCGSQRTKADKYKLTISLCHDCHMRVHQSPEKMQKCRELGQRMFEREHTRDEFVREFGRNYL